jgi:hypothetical protein
MSTLHTERSGYSFASGSSRHVLHLGRFKHGLHDVAGVGGYEQLALGERAEGLYVLGVDRDDLQQGTGPTRRSCSKLQQCCVLVRGSRRDRIQPNLTAPGVHVRQLREGQVQPSEHSGCHTRQLLQRAAEHERVLAPQRNGISIS